MQIFDALEKGLAIPRNPAGPVRPTGPLRNTPSDGQLNEILEAVRWAPSAYNTQPWHFQILCSPDHREEAARALSLSHDPKSEAAWILCYLDRTRMLPVADPLNTESYIALGMGCLNVQAASAALGLACQVRGPFGSTGVPWRPESFSLPERLEPYFLFEIGNGGEQKFASEPTPEGAPEAALAVYRLDSFRSKIRRAQPPPTPSNGPEALECIHARQTDRVPLTRGDSWPDDCKRILSAARKALEAHEAGEVELLLVEDPKKTMELTRLQERAWRQATGDRERFRETCSWIRFTEREWRGRGDGEWADHLGLSGWRKTVARLGLKTPLASLAMSLGADRLLVRRAETSPETTGAFLTTVLGNSNGRFETDDLYRRNILTGVGAALQSLWLTATALGASLQFQTSTIVQDAPRTELRRILSVPDTHDLLFLIRMGYPQRDPHYATIRRDPREVISRTG